MKIVHVCLLSAYRKGWTYQENMLARHHAKAGHVVTVVTTPFHGHGGAPPEGPGESVDGDVRVIRLRKLVGLRDAGLAWYRNLYKTIEREKPDLIYLHGTQCFGYGVVLRYLRTRPNVAFVTDYHSDEHNSARCSATRLLHRFIWGPAARACLARADQTYCITPATIDFVERFYGLPRERVSLLVLGADFDAIPLDNRNAIRFGVRNELGLTEDDILVVSGGKLDSKKLVVELARAISKASNGKVVLLLFGSIDDAYKKEVIKAVGNKRIIDAGWANEPQIYRLFLASDVAAFAGKESVLWQQSICCGLPGIFGAWPGNDYLNDGNAFLIRPGDQAGLDSAVETLTCDTAQGVRVSMGTVATRLGRERFSYAAIAAAVVAGANGHP